MKHRIHLGVFALALALGGCTAASTQTTIAAAEVALTAADQLALQYVTLPLCAPGGPTLCSNAATSAQIKTAALAAYKAVKAAEASGTTGDLAAANAAVAALSALVPAN